jgi:hypothetical protein
MTLSPDFKYDFNGLDIHSAIIVREMIRKKINSLEPSKIAKSDLYELDVALGEHIYREQLKLDEHYDLKK